MKRYTSIIGDTRNLVRVCAWRASRRLEVAMRVELRAGMLECETLCSDHCSSLGKMGINDYMICVESCMRDCAIAKDKPAKMPFK